MATKRSMRRARNPRIAAVRGLSLVYMLSISTFGAPKRAAE